MSEHDHPLHEVLPHGPGLQLLTNVGPSVDGWLECGAHITSRHSAIDSHGRVPATCGVEILAQACGIALARSSADQRRVGVVGAIRDYTYSCQDFGVGDTFRARVKPVSADNDVIVCDAELYLNDATSPTQTARITLVLTEGVSS